MSVETLTYAALGARLKIRQRPLVRLPGDSSRRAHFRMMAKLCGVDLAEIRHTPRPPGGHQAGNITLLAAKIEALRRDRAARSNGSRSQRQIFEP